MEAIPFKRSEEEIQELHEFLSDQGILAKKGDGDGYEIRYMGITSEDEIVQIPRDERMTSQSSNSENGSDDEEYESDDEIEVTDKERRLAEEVEKEYQERLEADDWDQDDPTSWWHQKFITKAGLDIYPSYDHLGGEWKEKSKVSSKSGGENEDLASVKQDIKEVVPIILTPQKKVFNFDFNSFYFFDQLLKAIQYDDVDKCQEVLESVRSEENDDESIQELLTSYLVV